MEAPFVCLLHPFAGEDEKVLLVVLAVVHRVAYARFAPSERLAYRGWLG